MAVHGIIETTESVVLDEPGLPEFLWYQSDRAELNIFQGVSKRKRKNGDMATACLNDKFAVEEWLILVCRYMGDIA